MPFSQYLASEILDWVTGGAFPAAPTTLAINIHNGNPGPAGTLNSIQATITGSANRTLISQLDIGSVVPVTPEGFEKLNTAVITITGSAVNGSPLVASHASLWDAQTGGNLLFYDVLAAPQEVRTGDLVKFDPATFSIASI